MKIPKSSLTMQMTNGCSHSINKSAFQEFMITVWEFAKLEWHARFEEKVNHNPVNQRWLTEKVIQLKEKSSILSNFIS